MSTRAKADREREPVTIHRDTAEREREALTQVNHQLLTQIKVLREAQQQVIELGTRKILVGPSSEAHQHPATPTDLRVKLNRTRSKAIVPHNNHENLQPDSLRKRTRGHRTPASKDDALRRW